MRSEECFWYKVGKVLFLSCSIFAKIVNGWTLTIPQKALSWMFDRVLSRHMFMFSIAILFLLQKNYMLPILHEVLVFLFYIFHSKTKQSYLRKRAFVLYFTKFRENTAIYEPENIEQKSFTFRGVNLRIKTKEKKLSNWKY